MAEADVADGFRLSTQSGWNQRAEDWRLLLRLAGGRFRVAVADGRVVATGGAVLYGTRLAWICMMLVEPELRGQGIGTWILEEVLAQLGGIENVGLDATPAGHPVYSKLGFTDAAGLVRMGARFADRSRLEVSGARPLSTAELPAVLEMDREAFGADRADVLRFALEQAPEYAWSLEEDGALAGYCFGRHGHHSEQIGPVVARGPETAFRLVSACLRHAQAERFVIDVPAGHAEWMASLVALGFEEQRCLTRMYRGSAHGPGRAEAQLAICGPELG
jgi:GNAT superfamily N-acetyltransferase